MSRIISVVNAARQASLKTYLTSIYNKTGYGFLGSLTVGAVAPVIAAGAVGVTSATVVPVLAVGYIANVVYGFRTLYRMDALSVATISDDGKHTEVKNPEKERMYRNFAISNGITIAPAISVALMTAPYTVPIALVASGATFMSATLYAQRRDRMDLLKYEAPLMGAVGGLIGTAVIQLIAALTGFTNVANTLDIVSALAGTGVFTALIAVDTQRAIDDYNKGKLDSVNAATSMLLDVTNLFLDLLRLLGHAKKALDDD